MSGFSLRHAIGLTSLLACTAATANPPVVRQQTDWKAVDGCAREISVAEFGKPLVVGCAAGGPGGFQIFRRNGSQWELQPGAGVKIADLGNALTPFIIDKNGGLWRGSGARQPGCVQEIASSTRPDLWAVNCDRASGGYVIQRADNLTPVVAGGKPGDYDVTTWQTLPSKNGALKVAVGDTVWMINRDRQIYTFDRTSSQWQLKPGCAVDIAANGPHAWVIGCAAGGDGGNQIFQWSASGWKIVKGAAMKVAVDNLGNPWVIDKSGGIWTWAFKTPR